MDVIVYHGVIQSSLFASKYENLKTELHELYCLQVQQTMQTVKLMDKSLELYSDNEYDAEKLVVLALLGFNDEN